METVLWTGRETGKKREMRMVNVYIIAGVFAVGVILIAMGLLIVDDSGAREQKLMGFFLAGVLIQNTGYLLELTAANMEVALAATKVQYLGSVFVPLCYCWFIYGYCNEKAPYFVLNLLGFADVCTLVSVFLLEHHRFYYRNIEWVADASGHYYLMLTYGPIYSVFIICGCIIPYFLSIGVLVKAVYTRPAYAVSRKYKTIMALSLLPLVMLVAYVMKLTGGFDPTPATIGLVLSLVVILIWRQRTYDFRRLASETLLDSMGDGVIALDTQKRILSYNQAAVKIFPGLAGRRAGDSVGDMKDFTEDMLKENAIGKFQLNERYYESHTREIVDTEMAVTGKSYRERRVRGYVILILDVTDTRNYIEEIKQVRQEAEKANRAKSEFLANMSHEIRTPMNAIIGLSDIILEESEGRKVASYACDIKSASQNLLAIINDILDLSKVEAGKMELVLSDYYVKSTVGEVTHIMDIAASQRGLLMKHEYDLSIPCQYNGDEGRLKQILINILNNAIKFTKHGYIKISVGGRPGENPGEELLIFRIQDTGCGIKKEDQDKIFENFRQVDVSNNRSVEGTGLGLSITKHLVQLMGGSIDLESVYGEGTTFTITIPQKIVDSRPISEVPDAPVQKKEELKIFKAKGYKVLVVDDNLINRKVARGFLNSYQFDLDEAASGLEAIDMVKKKRYDMILMDHMMPEMDGIEAVQIIRRECGENGKTPVVVALTANAMEGAREEFLANGFQDFLSKPLVRERLNALLLQWVPKQLQMAREPGDFTKQRGLAYGQIKIPGIDMDAAQKYQSGSLEDFMELLRLFCLDGNRKSALLQELLEKKDYRAYGVEVHGLKSASANIGAMELSGAAKEQETAAENGDGEFIMAHFSEFMSSYEEQIAFIQKFLKEQKRNGDKDENLPDMDEKTVAEEVEAALEQLLQFHSRECREKVQDLLNHRLKEDTRAQLEQIQEQLNLYEDDRAEELLGGLLEELKKEESQHEGKDTGN